MARQPVTPKPERGFTLLEVLVVVAIAAILTGFVVLRLGDFGADHSAERQLERLAALIDAQCEQALFQSRPRGLRITEDGYDFWQDTSGGWVALPGEGLTRPRRFPEPTRIELDVSGHHVRLGDEPEAPQLICEPLGTLTAFTLTLEAGDERMRLVSDGSGRLNLERG